MGGCASCCGSSEVQKNILLVGRSGAGKTHTLYQMMGESTTLDTAPTPVFNNEIISFRRYGRRYEFWDPSGADDYIQFWESLYKNIAFDVVIYVIDARKYWNKDERQHQIVRDRMELHNLLCCPELSECKVCAITDVISHGKHPLSPHHSLYDLLLLPPPHSSSST